MLIAEYEVASDSWGDGEPDEFLSYFLGKFKQPAKDAEGDETVSIGEMRGYRIHVTYAREEGYCLYDVFDAHSGDSELYYHALFNKDSDDYRKELFDDPPLDEDILFIDDLIIFPAYRGKQLGLQAIMNVIKTLGSGCGVILSQTLPLQHHSSKDIEEFREKIGTSLLFVDKDTGRRRIIDYLSRIGFRQIPRTPLCMIDRSRWSLAQYRHIFASE